MLEGKDKVELSCSWAGSSLQEDGGDGKLVQLWGSLAKSNLMISWKCVIQNRSVSMDEGPDCWLSMIWKAFQDEEVRNLIACVIQTLGSVQDSLPKDIVDDSGVLSLEDALREAHFPSNQNYKGRSRLAFEEVFLYHVGKRLNSKFVASNGVANIIQHRSLAQYSWIRSIQLSDEQEVVLSEIRQRDVFFRADATTVARRCWFWKTNGGSLCGTLIV